MCGNKSWTDYAQVKAQAFQGLRLALDTLDLVGGQLLSKRKKLPLRGDLLVAVMAKKLLFGGAAKNTNWVQHQKCSCLPAEPKRIDGGEPFDAFAVVWFGRRLRLLG